MAFSLNETTLLSAVKSGSILSIVNSTLAPGYGIYYATVQKDSTSIVGSKVFSPTSWISVEKVADASIVNSPIEQGSYSSYNKVKRPPGVRAVFTLEGLTGFSGAIPNVTNLSLLSRTNLIATLDDMIASANTYDIETPDTVYTGYDLERYDFKVDAKSGVTMLTVEASFQAVLTEAEVTLSSDQQGAITDKNQNGPGTLKKVPGQAASKAVTLDSVKAAWNSGTTSLSSSLSTTATYVENGLQSAVDTVNTAYTKATDSASMQLKDGITTLAKVIT
ncbi:hypothetical protein [Rouxiella sp. WC2420]|uniref:Phage tail protein n=1 Tax=Rouxiella sp. WC2420 TaxID=3234145 RepID=A0AB39VMR4_9GAMM